MNFTFILLILVVLEFYKTPFLENGCRISREFFPLFLFFFKYLFEIISLRDNLLTNPALPVSKFGDHIYLTGAVLFILFFAYINVKDLGKRFK